MVFLTFLFLHLILCCRALSWPGRQKSAIRSSANSDLPPIPPDQDVDLTGDDVTNLFLSQDSLEKYSHRPDCFQRAAALIRTRCSQLDMNEEERVKAAIFMTLCELATAKHHSPPLECAAFSLDSMLLEDSDRSQFQGDCVDALSRSAQFWSSYSGYLREVPQLCFAFRRWNDIDTAKDIYKNATLEKIALIRYLLVREKSALTNAHAWETRLEELRSLMMQMQGSSESFKVASEDLFSGFEMRFEGALESLGETIVEVQRRSEVAHLRSIAQIDSTLEHISQRHALSLASVLPSLEKDLISHLNSIYTLTQTQNQDSYELAQQAQQQWINLGNKFSAMHQTVSQLTDSATQAALSLDDSTQQARFLYQSQIEASRSASHLVDTITQLTTTTYSELEKINTTAVLLRESLHPEVQGLRWWKDGFIRAIEFIFCVDPASVEYLKHLPLFRFAVTLLGIFCYLFKAAMSSVMATIVVLASSKRYISQAMHSPPDPLMPRSLTPTPKIPCIPLAPSPLYQRQLPQDAYRYSSDLHIRNSYRYSRSGLRISRIPERLCNPTSFC